MKIKNKKSGKVYLVGAGAGEADFITLRGMKILSQADVVIYDYLLDKNVLRYASVDAELISADEIGDRKENFSDGFSKRQDLVNEIMVREALAGKNIVRLKNGDPMIFGRSNEEMTALIRNKIPFNVIPGVSAFLTVASLCGIPLTARGISSSVTLITGHEAPGKKSGEIDWKNLACTKHTTLVIYMGVENISKISNVLIRYGKEPSTPVAAISILDGYPPVYVESTLEKIPEVIKKDNRISAPSIFIIGDVVKLRKSSPYIKNVLFTGLSDERFFEEGNIYHHPMIKIVPLDDYASLDSAIKKIVVSQYYQWLVFTSRYGVYYFFKRLFAAGYDTRVLSRLKIASIGKSTAKMLESYGIKSDIIPKEENSKGLLKKFSQINIKGKHILMPRSDIADKGLSEGLAKLGGCVDSVIAYRNIPSPFDERLKRNIGMFDEIIFTSPSCVRNFIRYYGAPPQYIAVKTIGPITQKEWSKYASATE